LNYSQKFSRPAQAAQPDLINTILARTLARPDIISFAVGTPDTTLLPIDLLEKLTNQATEKYGQPILQYGFPKGFPPLIDAVQPWLKKRGISADATTIHISTGGSGALNNTCMALLDDGDIVLVESPTYPPAIKNFQAYGAQVVSIACDESGMLPAALEIQLKKQAAKFIYCLPTFQNPTGNVMPLERRQQIAALAQKYDTLIVEDDVYYDLRYRGHDVPTMQTFAVDHTIYLSSFSKIFAPAMRVGFAVLPEPILEKLITFKQVIDMATSPYTQALTTEFLLTAASDHVATLHAAYSAKLNALLAALKTHMPTGFSWNQPQGGLFVWVKGPDDFDSEKLLERAITAGVAYIPGSGFFVNPAEGRSAMRLCFAHPSVENIEKGIATLAKLCHEAG
jgi:2-aminoadipate transaminase